MCVCGRNYRVRGAMQSPRARSRQTGHLDWVRIMCPRVECPGAAFKRTLSQSPDAGAGNWCEEDWLRGAGRWFGVGGGDALDDNGAYVVSKRDCSDG